MAWEGETVFGFIPVEITDGGVAKINNYYVSGDDPHLLSRFLREIIQYYRRDYTIRSMTLIRHAEIFRSEGVRPDERVDAVRNEWSTAKTGSHECL